MDKVNGRGGLFFRTKDPDGLAHWYFARRGITLVPKDYNERPWWQEAGPGVDPANLPG